MAVDIVGLSAHIAFMEVAPPHPIGRSVVLLHGKNFCGATWQGAVRALVFAGYRMPIPDQIGFCKSSKPRGAQYGFEMLARGVGRAHVIGHSTGGMLAMRFATMFPDAIGPLVLVNPWG